MKIRVFGSLYGTSGYDIHCRGLANALHMKGHDVKFDGNLPSGWEQVATDAELLMIKKDFDSEAVTIMVGQPQFWPLALADKTKHFVGFLVWEGDRIPEGMVGFVMDERVDQIWVPSQHTMAALRDTFTPEDWNNFEQKVFVVPHGFSPSEFYVESVERDSRYTFIVNKGWRGGWNDRGGVPYVLKAYREEFSKEDNVLLKLKLNPAYLGLDFDMDKEIGALGLPDGAAVEVTDSLMSGAQLREFYNSGDCFVSASLADAFNIPGVEAMACGLPQIQSPFGGQEDYVSMDVGVLLDEGSIWAVEGDIAYEGICWHLPDIVSLRRELRAFYDGLYKERFSGGEIAKVSKGWTWAESVDKALVALKALI